MSEDPTIDTEEFWDVATRGRTEPLRPNPAQERDDEHLAIEFRHGRITRLFGVVVAHEERGQLSRFMVSDERTDVGGAVLTISDRKFKHLEHWQVWIIRKSCLLDWLRNGGDSMRLGMEILKFSDLRADGARCLRCGPLFPSLTELINQLSNAHWIHCWSFTNRLWTPATQAEVDAEAEKDDGTGTP